MEWEVPLEVLGENEKDIYAKIDAGAVFDAYLLDKQTYQRKYCKFKIAKSAQDLPTADKLWLRDFLGKLLPQAWAVMILEERQAEYGR